MSLSRQFSLGLLLVLGLVFVSTVWINVNSTRTYIDDQLTSHAQDTATSLGLSISPYLGSDADLPIVDAMINAIFDRGYYQSIVLTDMQDNVLLEKHNPPLPETVPDWFIQIFPLTPPVANTEINSGWTMAGKLQVKSHPGLGYAQLWENAKDTFWLTAVLFLLGIVLLLGLLKLINQPIKAVIAATERICARDFSEVSPVPKTRELNLMVMAINKMSAVLNKQYKELTAQAQSYYQSAYIDALTQLGNKLAMDNKLSRVLSDNEMPADGYLILIRLSSLAYVNESQGANTADIYIKSVAHILSFEGDTADLATEVFRIRGGDFALLLENASEEQCTGLLTSLTEKFNAQHLSIYKHGCAHMGAAHFTASTKRGDLLEMADSALTAALNSANRWQLASQVRMQQPQSAWRSQIQDIITHRSVDIVRQPVFNADKQPIYLECFARFKVAGGNEYIPMAQLVSEAEKLQLASDLDLLIIEKILEHSSSEADELIAINLSPATLSSQSSVTKLIAMLTTHKALCPALVFEIGESCLQQSPQLTESLADALRQLGAQLTIERVGSSIGAFTLLRKLRPNFIKIDGRFTRHIEDTTDNQFFVQSLVNIAHGLNIQVIAELVESEAEAQTLQSLFVDYFQGYYFGQPQKW